MAMVKTCTTCSSADRILEDFISTMNYQTSHHRVETQKHKCGFGRQGVCCRLCANGPCRITPNSPRGVCGADADTIVARNFLRAVAAGSGCYIHVLENAAHKLKKMAEKKLPLQGVKTLNRLAALFDISAKDFHQEAEAIADKVLQDLYKPSNEPMELVKKLIGVFRLKKWEDLELLPGGAKSEVFDGVVKTSTNLNSDPVNMLLHGLRLGISTGVYGLILTNLLNDVMLGEPALRKARVGLRVIDPDYINIMATGHQQALFTTLQQRLADEDIVAKAREAGAAGIHLIGCTCVGQDMQLRGAYNESVFAGHAGNNFTSEAVIATGAIDLIVSEFNCTLPGIEPLADELQVKMVCIDDLAKKSNAEMVPYDFEDDRKLYEKIIHEAMASFKARRNRIAIQLPADHGDEDVLTGVSEGSLKNFLGGNWKPLIELIVAGKIKGIAGVVGCSNLTAQGHDVFTTELTKALIQKDIMVLSAGCSSGGLENVGLMSPKAAALAGDNLRAVCETLGIPPVLNFGPCLAIGRLEIVAAEIADALNVDLPQLPLVMSAPQWLEEQAIADGSFALALGLPLHLAIPPFITGSERVTRLLTEDLKNLTGGHLILEDDIGQAADTLEQIILEKRKGLNL